MTKVMSKSKTTASKSVKSDTATALDEPIITVHNPFRYIFLWLEDIKNWIKKDSDGEISIHIPFKWFVTALCLFLVGGAVPAYWQGKAVEYAGWIAKPTPTPIIIIQPTPTLAPVIVTRLGVIKATYQVKALLPSTTPTPPLASPSSTLDHTPLLTVTDVPTPARYVLMTDTYKLIFLQTPSDLSLQKYMGYKALVTGVYTATSNTITVDRLEDIEVVY